LKGENVGGQARSEVKAVYRAETFKFTRGEMLARDEVEAYMFGRMDERLAILELLSQYLEDPRSVKVLKEIMARICAKGT